MSKYTLGVEEEYFLLNRETYQQGHMSADFARRLQTGYYRDTLTDEVFDSHLEARTPVCSSVESLEDAIKWMRKHADKAAGRYGLTIASSGTMPVIDWTTVKIISQSVENVIGSYGDAFKSQSIAGLHLHVKIDNLDAAFRVINYLSWYSWIFAALTGSSRYYNGRDTGVSNYRLALMRQTVRTGLPPLYRIGTYYAERNALEHSGWSANKLWYYVRLNPNTETVELRICDSVPYVDDVLAIAQLFANMAKAACEKDDHLPQIRQEVEFKLYAEENIDRAMRFGTKSVDVYSGRTIAEVLEDLPIEIPEGVWHILERGNASERMEPIWKEGGAEAVAKYVAEATMKNL